MGLNPCFGGAKLNSLHTEKLNRPPHFEATSPIVISEVSE